MKVIGVGAEAKLLLDESNNKIIKIRIKKGYRHKHIDERLRKQRTRREGKILERLSHIIAVPFVYAIDEKKFSIEMEFVRGIRLSDRLEELSEKKKIAEEIGRSIAAMHNINIIHGDLTTSNMIYKDEKVYFIDFGLAFHSNRIEDKAVDLYLLLQALKSKHYKIWKEFGKEVLHAYLKHVRDASKIRAQLKKVMERGRYKKQREKGEKEGREEEDEEIMVV